MRIRLCQIMIRKFNRPVILACLSFCIYVYVEFVDILILIFNLTELNLVINQRIGRLTSES